MNEFSTQLHDTIDAFNAPPVPLGAICERGSQATNPQRRRSFSALYAAVILTCSAAAVALGAEMVHNLSFKLNPSGTWNVTTPTLTCQWRATPAMAYYVSKLASYPVVLPTGLPSNARVTTMCNAGPDALFLFYAYPRKGMPNGHLGVVIAPPAQMAVTKSALSRGVRVKSAGGGGKHWLVGPEEVFVLNSTLTTAQMDEVERMMKSAPR